MSIAPAEPQPDPVPFPETIPHLPVIQFSSGDPLLQMHFSLADVAEASEISPNDAFYDSRGILLEQSGDIDRPDLEARGAPEPDALRERALAVLRDMFERSRLDETEAAEIEAILRWLDAAPTIAHLLHGMGFAPVRFLGEDGGDQGRRCIRCTGWERITGTRPCC